MSVIDAPCGAGKTTWAIQLINQNPDKSFVFCTPYLDEIKRIRSACGFQRIKEPFPNGGSKLDDFNRLLTEGVDIAVTHATFMNATEETIQRISEGDYTLILDEAVDPIWDFNSTAAVEHDGAQRIKHPDIEMLLEKDIIAVKENGKVVWTGRSYDGGKFSALEALAKQDRVYLVRGDMLICEFPPEVFTAFSSVYVLTYLFGGSVLKPYYDLHQIPFERKSIRLEDGRRMLVDYDPQIDIEHRRWAAAQIDVYMGSDLNLKKETLSKSWFDYRSGKKDGFATLRRNIGAFFRKQRAKAADIMWTCPEAYWKKLTGKGYTYAGRFTPEEKALPEQERMRVARKCYCFVPCNARATNAFGDRSVLAYLMGMYYNPILKGFFQDNGVAFDEEQYALSCLIQWIWRSRIRNGEPISVFIPAKRMRELFLAWLNPAEPDDADCAAVTPMEAVLPRAT